MKILITGGDGFVAPFLAKELLSFGHEIRLTSFRETKSSGLPKLVADLSDRNQAVEVVKWANPDAVVHLAGISNVGAAESDRAGKIVCANVNSTQYLCEALHQLGKPTIFLFVSTGLVYSPVTSEGFAGYDEQSQLGPVNDYGWSKLAAESILRIYESPSMRTYIARPFNHTGPGQDQRFVCPALASRIAQAKNGDCISIGNLRAERDFSDVRDIARAYRLILEGRPDERTFVLGSGQPRSIQSILDFFLEYSGKRIAFEVDSGLLRTEHDRVVCRPLLAEKVLTWIPSIPFKKTLSEVYDLAQAGSAQA